MGMTAAVLAVDAGNSKTDVAVVADDGEVLGSARGPGFLPCEVCGKTTQSLSIPREADLKAWGAPKKTKTEVSGR